jgi:glyceraldehyde 3-phosphate dehydrogenase (phosphorylating)
MAIKLGINGFGRIGRSIFRVAENDPDIEVVAVNDLTDAGTLAHLLKYDSVNGRFEHDVKASGNDLKVGGRDVKVYSERDPGAIPWKDLGVEVVMESTGLFRERDKAAAHLRDTVKKVIISAPAKGAIDGTFVLGVNDEKYDKESMHVISNASCTTNCLAPVAKVLQDSFGIKQGVMTTIHAYTNDQRLLDLPHKDLRRARAAAINMIPTTTGAAKAVGLVLPELSGKLNGMAIRVPTPNVSMVDLVVNLEKECTAEMINTEMKKAADGPMKGILDYYDEPIVSIDLLHSPASSSFDSLMTAVYGGNMAKIITW